MDTPLALLLKFLRVSLALVYLSTEGSDNRHRWDCLQTASK